MSVKKNIILLIMALICSSVSCFANRMEEIYSELEFSGLKPSRRVELLLELRNFWKEIELDKLIEYSNEAEKLCEQYSLEKLQVEVYYWKSHLNRKTGNQEIVEKYFKKARELSEKINTPEVLGKSYYLQGIHYIYNRDYKSAERELSRCLEYEEYLSDRDMLRVYNNLANINYYFSNFAVSLSYYLKQRDLSERTENVKEQAYAYSGIGNIYNELDNLELAKEYYLKAINRLEKIGEYLLIYSIENNLGTIYSKMNDYESAEDLYKIVLSKAEEFNDIETVCYANINFGMIEMTHKKNYEKALEYFKIAESYKDKIVFEREIALLYLNFGSTLYHLSKYDEAEKYLEMSYEIAESILHYSIIEDVLEIMMKIGLAKGDLDKTAEVLSQYLNRVLDTKADAVVKVSEIHKQYNQEKFDQQLKILEQRDQINMLQLHQQQRITFFIIIFLFFIVLAFFYVIYTNRQLSEMKKNLERKVKDNLEKLRMQDSLLIIQNHQAAMGEMLSMIAHQWKQPLNSIGLISQNLEDAYEFDEFNEEVLHDSVKNIMDQIFFMSNTLNSFRDYYTLGNDKSFSLKSAVTSSIKYCEPLFNKYHIKVSDEIEEEYYLFGQINLLVQVFLSLIVNSRDAFEEKNIENREIVFSRESVNEDSIEIAITDNAGGISEDNIGNIFKPYFTTKDKDKGTGIGLYICESVIKQKFNGKIRAYNAKEGSRFIIELPLT